MYVATLHFKRFDEDLSASLVKTLSRFRQQVGSRGIKGLVQTQLLRADEGGALLLTTWQSRSELKDFIESDEGRTLAEDLADVVGRSGVEVREYRTVWRAYSEAEFPDAAYAT